MENILIYEGKEFYANSNTYLCLDSRNPPENHISIINLLEENSILYRNKAISLIRKNQKYYNYLPDFIVKAINLDSNINMLDVSELMEQSQFKSPILLDLVKTIAIRDYLSKRKIITIRVISENHHITECIRNYAKSKNINFSQISPIVNKYNLKRLVIRLKIKFLKIISIFFTLIKFFCLSLSKNRNISTKNNISLFGYFVHIDENLLEKGILKQLIWGDLFNILKMEKIKINHFQFYCKTRKTKNVYEAHNFANKFSDKYQEIHIIDTLITIKSYFLSIFLYLKSIILSTYISFIREKNVTKNDQDTIYWPILKKIVKDSFRSKNTLTSILFFYTIKDFLSRLKKQKLGIYLLENQGWEKALTYNWQKYNHGKLYAHINVNIRFWGLNFYQDYNSLGFDKLLLMSKKDKELIKDYISESKIYMVENLRYSLYEKNYLLNKKLLAENNKSNLKNIKILLLGDYDKATTKDMLNIVHKTIKDFQNIIIKYRPHPNCFLELPPDDKILLSSEDINKEILNSEIIISSSITSACIDAYIRGNSRIAIFLSNDKFNLSPLRNFENIKSFSSAKELKKIISEKNKKEKSSNSKLINIDSSLKNWKSLFLYN